MNSKDKRGKSCSQHQHNGAGDWRRNLQQTQGNEIKEHRVGRMKENIRQMIAECIHTPQQIVQAECKPTERLIMTQVKGRKHPAQMRPGKTSEVLVFNESFQVVPIDEAVS